MRIGQAYFHEFHRPIKEINFVHSENPVNRSLRNKSKIQCPFYGIPARLFAAKYMPAWQMQHKKKRRMIDKHDFTPLTVTKLNGFDKCIILLWDKPNTRYES